MEVIVGLLFILCFTTGLIYGSLRFISHQLTEVVIELQRANGSFP